MKSIRTLVAAAAIAAVTVPAVGHIEQSEPIQSLRQSSFALLGMTFGPMADMVKGAQPLQGFVWTQLTDIQQEINGLLYFDRQPKLPLATLKEIFTQIGASGDAHPEPAHVKKT